MCNKILYRMLKSRTYLVNLSGLKIINNASTGIRNIKAKFYKLISSIKTILCIVQIKNIIFTSVSALILSKY